MTLVELLLALTLFSFLLASSSGLLTSAMRAQADWGGALAPYQQLERALHQLEDDLESAQPFFGVPFVGKEQSLEFARLDRVGSDGRASPDWVRVIYQMENDGDGAWLVREEFAWRTQDASAAPQRREKLLHLVHGSFAFRVLDAQGQPAWVPSWDGKTLGIPRLVKFDGAVPTTGAPGTFELSRVVRDPAGAMPKVETPP